MSAPGPPSGPSQVPIDPARAAESNTARIVSIVTVFHVIALTTIALRIYARVWVIRNPGADDWVMLLCAACAMGGWSIFIIQAHYGLGKHQDTIETPDFKIFQHAGFWQSIISAAGALMWLKISIALNLLRLSQNKWYTWSLWATIAFNIFTDVVLATLPIPIIWNLQMKRRVRLSVIVILSLGYFLQLQLGIIAACAPALKPLVSRFLKLSTAGDHRYPSGRSQPPGSIGLQTIGGSGPARRHTMKPSFESDERVSGGSDGGSLGGAGSKGQNEISVQGAFYKHGEGGSEERILEDQSGRMGPQRVKGIMRTTEVIVQ
ncbi:uncharacterized protein VDAG_08209 [Verticillium dahliae VdLs.17]|uniref:Rhodopsin domain-containing protein n=1 Tax=Verticillium dahliae (strain VdLs.17 / ATCC MYA-4575 / FGSC 10137) TaxID=498257 RepID=G2XDH7_VERDV|nr:uncharacterized protein VDAG_08209 [Verticillium dahliae VdLs.17]EGY17045.1 hypothetical protein VDAG_08209 [Verticillium dahliae VdLs.17]